MKYSAAASPAADRARRDDARGPWRGTRPPPSRKATAIAVEADLCRRGPRPLMLRGVDRVASYSTSGAMANVPPERDADPEVEVLRDAELRRDSRRRAQ